jgi:lactate dehydrogenase-like 2-hydroxyacid dehydrogenase
MGQTRKVLIVQGVYYIATGVAPFISRRAFESVTGSKREWWLVETVGALVTAVGAGALAAAVRDSVTPELVTVAAGCAAGLATIDIVYVARRRIAPVYLVDAAAEVALLTGLATARRTQHRTARG